MRTELGLSGKDADLSEETVLATLGHHPTGSAFGLEGGLGALVHGRVGNRDLDPGFVASVTGSWLALPETAVRPFVLLAVTASVLAAPHFTAGDARLSVVAGKTFFTRFTPYLVGRLFGGPVMTNLDGMDVSGGDQHHFAVGAGGTLRLGQLDLLVEAAPLGERSLSAGAGFRF